MNSLKDEHGFTLIETVIAMALLVGVLIPLGVVVGNFMLDKRGADLHSALRLAESEVSRVVTAEDFSSGISSVGAFSVQRTIRRNGNIVRFVIAVSSGKDPATPLCVLQKSVLEY